MFMFENLYQGIVPISARGVDRHRSFLFHNPDSGHLVLAINLDRATDYRRFMSVNNVGDEAVGVGQNVTYLIYYAANLGGTICACSLAVAEDIRPVHHSAVYHDGPTGYCPALRASKPQRFWCVIKSVLVVDINLG